MAMEKKQLLIVDDTEIDRIILKSILSEEYAIHEAVSGSMAIEYISKINEQLDAILLDVSMPNIDGFDVLKFMRDKGIVDIPVFLITAEPTRDKVERALLFNVDEFIGKPFDKEDLLRRLRSRLGVIPVFDPAKDDINMTREYIADLEEFYRTYLGNFGKSDIRCRVMVDLMRILLNKYNHNTKGRELDSESIELISKAAYFCDIGEILIPDKRLQAIIGTAATPEGGAMLNHTLLGSKIIRLNRAKECSFFVEVCASMCLRHHERYDGEGYPDGIVGKNNSIYNQLCRLVDTFEQRRSKFYGSSATPVKFVIKRLLNDDPGMVSEEVYDLLDDCELEIVDYFLKNKF